MIKNFHNTTVVCTVIQW